MNRTSDIENVPELTENISLAVVVGTGPAVGTGAGPAGTTSRDSRETAEIFYYTLLVLFGGPLNLLAFYKSLKKTSLIKMRNRGRRGGKADYRQHQMNKRPSSHKPAASGGSANTLHLLILNLNLTDLIIIFIYLPTQIFWRITVQWYGGDVMCRFLRFLHQLSFHLSSYTVAGIATERFNAVSRKTFHVPNKLHVRFRLITIWAISILCSSPNLIIWQVYEPWPGYVQCTTQFIVSLHSNRTTGWQSYQTLNNVFQVGGILTVFWLPAFYISCLYLYIFIKLRRLALSDPLSTSASSTTTTTATTTTVNNNNINNKNHRSTTIINPPFVTAVNTKNGYCGGASGGHVKKGGKDEEDDECRQYLLIATASTSSSCGGIGGVGGGGCHDDSSSNNAAAAAAASEPLSTKPDCCRHNNQIIFRTMLSADDEQQQQQQMTTTKTTTLEKQRQQKRSGEPMSINGCYDHLVDHLMSSPYPQNQQPVVIGSPAKSTLDGGTVSINRKKSLMKGNGRKKSRQMSLPSLKSNPLVEGGGGRLTATATPQKVVDQLRRGSVPQWRLQLQSKQVLFSKTGLLVLVYFACWLPYFASSLMPAQLKILAVLIAMNAAVNPIIYAFE